MKKILMICPFARPNIGGAESHLDKLINYLYKKNVFVYLLAYQPLASSVRGEKIEKGSNFEIHRVSWFGNGWFNKLEKRYLLSFIYVFPGLFVKSFIFAIKKRKEIDCYHAHGLIAAMIVKVISLFCPARTVVSTHAIYDFARQKKLALLVKWTLFSFDEILAVSEVSKSELISIGLNKGKINVHKNWIELDKFFPQKRESCKRKLGLSGNVVLFVGRMIEIKGVNFLLNSAKKFNNINFVFVGDGPVKPEIEDLSQKRKNIIYVGKLQQSNPKEFKKLIEYYSAADLFATIPTYDEGFGAAYIEALSCGTPVLASNKGSLPTFLKPSVSILIKPTQNEVDKALRKLFVNDRNLLKDIKQKARNFAQEHFSDKNAEVILNSYRL